MQLAQGQPLSHGPVLEEEVVDLGLNLLLAAVFRQDEYQQLHRHGRQQVINLAGTELALAAEQLEHFLGFFLQAQRLVHRRFVQGQVAEELLLGPSLQASPDVVQDCGVGVGPVACFDRLLLVLLVLAQTVVIRLSLLEHGVEYGQQPVLGQRLQHRDRIFLPRDLLHLPPQRRRLNIILVVPFQGGLKQILRAGIGPETQADGEPQQAQQAHRVVQEAVGVQDPQLAVLQVSQAVRGVQQQAPGARGQRDPHGVHRKVSPPQVLQDGRRPDVRGLARLLEELAAGHFQTEAHPVGQLQLGGAPGLVLLEPCRPPGQATRHP